MPSAEEGAKKRACTLTGHFEGLSCSVSRAGKDKHNWTRRRPAGIGTSTRVDPTQALPSASPMSASWDSDLSSIIEKTNNNLKLLRKIGDKPQVRADVSVTTAPSLARSGSASGSISSHSSARPRAYVGAQDDAGSTSSRGSARPRAFIRGDDDTSSMGSHGSARPKAFVRGDDDTGSMGSHGSARPRAFIRADDDAGSASSRASARPKAFIRPDDDAGSASSRASARPKAFIRADDDAGSVSSRASARPKAFIRGDDDTGSISSRSSARPKAFIRGDDDTGSMSSRSSARPKAFIRGDDDSGSMSSNQGLGRSRLDSGHGSVASSSGRPHVGIAGGGGLTAAMLQQHRATAGAGPSPGGLGMADLGAPRSRMDLDETRSMSGVSASRLRRPLGANGRVPHARALGASMGPRIRVPESEIPSDIPNHVVDELKKSLETQFASRNGAVDKKVADLRTDVASLTTQTSSLSSQMSELRDAVLLSANSKTTGATPSVSDPKVIASVQANAAAIARLEEHSADLLGRKVSVDRELAELASRVKAGSSGSNKISTLEDNIEALVASKQKQEQGLFKLADRVQLMHRQMGNFVDMKAVENLLSIRLTREFREMEDRLSQNVLRMAEKMEQKVHNMEKQSYSQRQESLTALKNDLSDDIQRLQSSALRKSDLLSIQNAQTQSKEDLAQLSNALDRQEKKLHDAKLANSTLRDELADARAELNKALQSQTRSAAALMEEKLEAISSNNKDKSNKIDDQLSELAKKQKKLEEATKTLQETMTQVKAEAGQRLSRTSADREEENDKLRQRLARSVAELEALATTKAEVERRFASEEQQYQARLKELRTSLTETEKQKEAQRLELMQKLQEESKLMGVAQGKNSLLENLLAREKSENEEKNELVRKSKKEVAEVREQIHNLETEKEKKVRQLTSELQAKQTQVGLLTKTLKRIETASAKMLDLSKREAKTVRRVKATKEHELFIAQLKLKEMERVAQALQNGDEMKKQAALTAASTEERNELEKLLLDSQLEKDELKQELEEMTEEFNAAKESQKVIMEDTITKLSSDYDDKISELKQQISDKEQAMRQLRDTLVEKSNLDALEDELTALKDEKNDMLEQIQRAQIEHERVTLKTETNLRLEHATEFAAMKSKFEDRISELESAKTELESTKSTIAELEKQLEEQEALHQREVSSLAIEIKEARSKIDECTAQILDLEEVKARLEGEVSQMEANIGGASAEKEEELAAIKSRMQSEVEKLRAELSEVSSTLEEKQTQLKEAKQSDEANRQRLVEMAMAQEEMQSRYVSQIDSLTLKLNQERESSRSREQDLEDSIDKLNADVKSLKAESSKELAAARSELTDQMTELTTTLQASQHREQQLQSRLKRILEELVQAANASGENEVPEDAEMSDDEAITHHLDALYATHRRTAHELERLQAEYELTVKQAAADSATAQELDNQVKEHATQIKELEAVVEQLREELKEQYHKSAIIAKGSDEFSEEMMSLREEKRELERQIQEEEKDRAKREVSYQRRTEMKEREVEELRTENKTLTAAVAAVREKIRAVENVKYHDLGELQEKLKDLEQRTAALQPDENNVANMEMDFTATRHEIVTLTAEVQSLYQKLTACCGIMEWSELRASVFDEEEKLTRVRAENARELAKVQSVEQEVLTNAEFLNALLVAHGSTGGDENLLNDFRWMQKYASIAPEIVEKLRKVESRLRDAVLEYDGSTSLFPAGSKAPLSNVSEAVAKPPTSQNSAVDGAAIAIALEKAKTDYFSETSDGGEDEKLDVDQPDVEQESLVGQEEGASHENVDVEGQDSIGASSHDESGTIDDDLGVAEHVVVDEQDRSREAQDLAMSLEEKEELSDDEVKDSEQDRSDDEVEGLMSSVDRKIEEMAKIHSTGFSEDEDMDEVERLMLDRHSSKQVNPRIDNECDDSDEFATSSVQRAETEDKSEAESDEVGENSADDLKHDFVEQAELGEAEHDVDVNSGDELDPLGESSFDNAMLSALESRESRADQSDSESFVAVADSSFDGSMLSEKNENSATEAEAETNVDTETERAAVDSKLESSEGDVLTGSEMSTNSDDERVVEKTVEDEAVEARSTEIEAVAVELPENAKPQSSLEGDVLSDKLPDNLELENSLDDDMSDSELDEAVETPSNETGHAAELDSSFEGDVLSDSEISSRETVAECDEGSELEESVASNALSRSADESSDALEESARSVDINALADRYEQGSVLEESTGSAMVYLADEDLLEVSVTSSKNFESKRYENDRELEQSASVASGDEAEDIDALDDSTSDFRRLDYQDDDSIRSPLLDQNEAPQQPPAVLSRVVKPLADEDEFGETSLQSLNDDFGDSIGHHEGGEEDAFGEGSVRSRGEEELERTPATGNEVQLSHDEAPLQRPTGLGRFLKPLADEEEFGETSLQSLNDDFDESLVQESRIDHEDEFGETSIHVSNASASSVDHGHTTHDVSSTELEESERNETIEKEVVLEQSTEDNAMEESSSSVEHREYFSDRMFASPAYEDPLALQSDDEGDERAVISRSDHLENSFDLHSDDEEEVSHASADAVQPVQPLKLREEDDDNGSEEQLRAPERSVGGTVETGEDIEARDPTESDPVPAMALHMEDDESSEEEETMPVQAQTTFSASLGRFGLGTTRLNLEEDDEMDEIERMLLDQSESTMQRRLQPSPIDRLSRSLVTGDEFGGASSQSEEGEDSIRSHEEERGEASSSGDDVLEKLLDQKETPQRQSAGLSRILKPLADDDEFGETSLQSLNEDGQNRVHEASMQSEEDEFGENSIRSREEEFGEGSVRSREGGSEQELEEASTTGNEARLSQKEALQQQPRLSRFLKPLGDEDEFGETSLQSLNNNFKGGSIRSHEASEGDEFGEDSIRSRDEEELGEASSSGGDMLEALLDQKEASTGLSRLSKPLTDEGEFGEASLQLLNDDIEEGSNRPLETSLQSEGDEFDEISIRSRGQEKHIEALTSEEPRQGKKEASQQKSTGLSRFLKPLADDDEFGEISLQSLNDDFDGLVRRHEASGGDEFGEDSTRSRDEETFEKASATGNEPQRGHNQTPQQRPTGLSRFLKPLADEEEFGETSLQSLNDDFKESLIQGSHIDREDGFGDTSIQSRRQEFGEASGGKQPSELSEALSRLRDGNDFATRSHDEDESVLSKSHGDDEFGEATGSYDEDDFGEISIPLQEDAVVAPPAPSRLPTRLNDSPNSRTVFQQQLMHSPTRVNRTIDSASEGEGDYMEDSFDLDESMEEEEDNEQHI
ncbi:hypothetical protein P3T76_012946 [Phytophthora citrophthora]|uniref:Uncharacterized protein n=1 Tax=Phytophthora citrophthora TaxID=4793 RepID=A0AAD9G504_9STRA|nr:hypothetical protein P3T76_012946 [Phytophthora citrophthora]